MAIAPPELTYRIKIDTAPAERESRAFNQRLINEASAAEQRRVNDAARIRTSGEAKREQQSLNALQRQKLAWERHYNSLALTEEKARLKSIKGQESWSARMTKGVDSLAMSVKGFALAWGATQITGIVRDSLNFAGGMRDAAEGVNLTTQQFFALTSALRDAGVQAEKIDPMLTRLGELTTGGASEKQQAILDRLGINATAMTNVQLLDTLLKSINERTVTQAELGELVGNRVVPSWNRLAAEINSVNEAQARYKMPLTDAEIDRLDRMARAWDTATDRSKLFFADVFTNLDEMARKVGPLALFLAGPGVVLGAAFGQAAGGATPNEPFPLVGSERFRNPPAAGGSSPAGGGGSPIRIPRPVDMSGRELSRAIPQADRSFDLPQITQQLPVAQGQTEAWNKSLETTVSLVDRIEVSVSRVANSGAWQVAQAGVQSLNSVLSVSQQVIQSEVDALQTLMQMEQQRFDDRVRMAQEAGLANSASLRNEAREHERIEKQRQKRILQLQAHGFEINKASRISETIMNTATAIMNAYKVALNPVIGAILAGMYTATGAAQVALISSQQNPYKGYAFGGYVPGNSLGDEQPILTTGGEFVVNAESTRRNRAALEYANRGGDISANGGGGGVTVVIQGDILTDDYWVEQRLIPKLRKAISRGYAIA